MREPAIESALIIEVLETILLTLPAFLHSLRTEVGNGLLIPNGMLGIEERIQVLKDKVKVISFTMKQYLRSIARYGFAPAIPCGQRAKSGMTHLHGAVFFRS